MADDGSIKIGTKIDTTGISEGIDKVTQKINKLADNKTLTSFAKLGASVTGLQSAFSMVTGAVSKVNAAIKETTTLYKNQYKAETQLSTAVKNNPLLDSSSVTKLKDFASQLQSISTTGDEELLPLMAQLASAGRTEQEIMDIMSASLDVAASGSMSLESAVRNLNKTFGGYSGELGETNPQVKALTEEQLKQGEAVKIVANQYKGMAEQVSSATGTTEQLKNAWGDLKEALGKPLNAIISPIEKAFTNVINNINEKLAEQENRAKTLKGLFDDEGKDASDSKSSIEELENEIKYLDDTLRDSQLSVDAIKRRSENIKNALKAENESIKQQISDLQDESKEVLENIQYEYGDQSEKYKQTAEGYWQKELDLKEKIKNNNEKIRQAQKDVTTAQNAQYSVQDKLNMLGYESVDQMKEKRDELQQQLDLLKQQEQQTKKNNVTATTATVDKSIGERDELRKQYDETVRQAKEEIKQRRALGEEISEEEEAQTMLNTTSQAYIAMMSSEAFKGNSGTYQHEVDARKEIAQWAEKTSKYDQISSLGNAETLEELQKQKDLIVNIIAEAEEEGIDKSSELWKTYEEKRKEIEDKIAQYTKDKNKETWDSVLKTMNEFVSAAAQIASTMSDIITTEAENRKDNQEAILEEQYQNEEITEDEYNERKKQIEKEYAQEEYKAKMWEWTTSIAQIGVSTAQAITNALSSSQYPAVGIALASVMGALGAAQLASAIANKPVPPSYASGGVIGGINGASMGGDNTYAHVRNGEMVLNAKQQKALWAVANNGGSASGGNVYVRNYAGNDVSVQPQLTEDGVKIMIRKTVAAQMKKGEYNAALAQANNTLHGVRYTS